MAFPNFYGKPGEAAPDFLDNLEMAFLVSGRDDEATKLRAFPLVLREGAKAWYQTLAPEERRDWETLKTAFIEEFRHQEPPEEIWRQLLELRQTSPNDYRSYEGKFSNLWEKWCASLGEGERAPECLKKDCFLAGLYPILREKVKVKFPDTFEKAMAYAREKDRKLKFQAQLQGGMEPPPPAQPIARTVAGTSVTDQESSQQELLQQITNQLESLSINLVQGVRAPQSGNDRNRQEGQRQPREYVCYNCGEVGHGMYFCPHPRRYQGNGNHRRAPRQQVTPPRARPPNGQQNAPLAPPVQILRPPPPPPQTLAEIPPLPSGGEDRAVSVISQIIPKPINEYCLKPFVRDIVGSHNHELIKDDLETSTSYAHEVTLWVTHYQALGMIEDLPAASSQASLIQQANYVPKAVRTTSSATSSKASKTTRSKKSSSEEEQTETDKEQDSPESAQEEVPKEVGPSVPSEYESDEDDTSIPLERKSQKPRSQEQLLLDEAMARVEARRKELAKTRAAKAAGKTKPMTMDEAKKIRLEKAKAIQKERKRIEAEQRAQEEAEAAKAASTQETEVVDLSGTLEYLKKLEREKHTAEQRAAQLAREKIKEGLSRKAEEPVLEPTQGSPKRPRQEEEEDIEDIQADPIPPSPINIPLAPPISPITPFPLASTPQTPPSPLPLETPLSPPAPISPQQQHPSAETAEPTAPITEETSQPMEASPPKETAQPLDEDEEPSSQEAILEVKSFDYTGLLQTLTRQFQCQQVVAKETEIQKTRANQAQEENANLRIALELVTKERDSTAKENENLIRDLIDLESQLTRKEAQNHELIKNDKKMKEQLKYEDDRYQKLNASYNTVKNTLTALLQNQEPAAAAPSTSDSAALNTLAALQAELNTEKLQRQLLVSGFMSQTAQHEAKVKQLEEELAKAKAELAAVGSLASTSEIQQAEAHVHIQPPQLPKMPEFQGIEEEQQQRPAPGALDIREEIEQEIEDLPEGPAKEYLMYKKKVMQSVALAFLQPEEQVKDFGTDFWPLPLMRHEAILWKEKMRPSVQRNEDGGYEGISLTVEEAKTLIEDHPRWRRKWLSERPRNFTNFHNTPQLLQIDPTYCPVPRRRTWAEFQKWRGKRRHSSITRSSQHKNHQW
ncbi:hypothetical protein L7F22_032265 [Adiantum nelumboides]|nr:hypothetical protein [Adiantum nelumboides]